MSFNKLVNEQIPELLENLAYDSEKYRIEFEYMGYDESCNKYYEYDYCNIIGTIVKITDKTTGESISTTLDLLKIPVPGELGYKLGKTNKQILKVDKRAPGWFIMKSKKGEDEEQASEKETLPVMEYNSNFKRKLYFFAENNHMFFATNKEGSQKITVSKFLKAITGKSYTELLTLLGTNKFTLGTFGDKEPDVGHCIRQVANKLISKNLYDRLDDSRRFAEIHSRLFAPDIIGTDGAGHSRYLINTSFLRRAFNKELARDVQLGNQTIKAGTKLTTEVLKKIDDPAYAIETLYVKHNNKVYTLKKYEPADDRLSVNEILTMVNMYATVLDGFDSYDDQYDTSSRIILTYENEVLNKIVLNCKLIQDNIRDILAENSGEDGLDLRSQIIKIPAVNIDCLLEELKDSDNSFVQELSNTNLLKLEAINSKITAEYGGKASSDAIKVQDRERGRTDQIDQPESNKIGKVHYETILAKKDKFGFQTTPYQVVENGVIKDEIVYLTADEESKYYIASDDETFEEDITTCYYDGTVMSVPRELVKFKEVSPIQSMSISRAWITFQEFSNPKRLLMGSNHLKQAIYTLRTERPLVTTGSFSVKPLGIIRAKDILQEFYTYNSSIISVTEEEFITQPIKLVSSSIRKGLRYLNFQVSCNFVDGGSCIITKQVAFMQPTDAKTVFSNKLVRKPNNTYQGDDIVVHNCNVDIRKKEQLKCVNYGALNINEFDEDFALGVNLKVAYKTFEGSTIEDALSIRKSKCYDGSLTSVSIKEISMEIFSDGNNYEEFFGTDGTKVKEHIQSNGLPKIGTYLKPGEVVMYKYRKCTDGTSYNIPVTLDNNTSGEVISAEIQGKEAIVTIASVDSAEVGDKMSGRWGNKGVIAKVVDDDEMPYLEETGEIIDVMLNPLGIPSRMNISQILEVCLGMALSNKTKMEIESNAKRIREEHATVGVISPFHKDAKKFVQECKEKYNVKPQWLIDGRTGDRIKRPVEVGIMYMLKLEHLAKKKLASVNITNNLNPITGQPQKGSGGQAVGEMETWVLGVEGCDNFLQDILSFQSDDVAALDNLKNIISSNPNEVEIDSAENRNNLTVQAILMALGVKLVNDENGDYLWEPLTDEDITKLAVKPLDTDNLDSLSDKEVFGGALSHKFGRHNNKARFGYIKLGCRIVNPFWLTKSDIIKDIPVVYHKLNEKKEKKVVYKTLGDSYKDILEGKLFVGKVNELLGVCEVYQPATAPAERETSIDGINYLLDNTRLDLAAKFIEENWGKMDGDRDKLLVRMSRLQKWHDDGKKLSDLIVSHYPVLSPVYRPGMADRNQQHDLDYYYRSIFSEIETYKKNPTEQTKYRIYLGISKLIGIGDIGDTTKAPLLKSYMGKGKDDKGDFRTKMLGKRVHFSGRSIIVPSQDTTMNIDTIGIPKLIGINIWELHLVALLKKNSPLKEIIPDIEDIDDGFFKKLLTYIASDNVYKFYTSLCSRGGYTGKFVDIKDIYYRTCRCVFDYLEKQVIVAGRQPSLHKFGSRAYKIRVTNNRAIEVHPLVCKGYNADFDGDTMYLIGVITETSKQEVLSNLTPKQSIINPKDGSAIIEHSQDMCLGIYFATMLYNNITSLAEDDRYQNIYHANNVKALQTMIDSDLLELQDLVTVKVDGRKYISTAGRILFNSLIPKGFTEEPFKNTLKIPNVDVSKYCELRCDGLIAKGSGQVGDVKYFSLSSLSEEIHKEEDIETTMKMFQDTMEFGFRYSDLSGITIGMDDLILDNAFDEAYYNKAMEEGKPAIEKEYEGKREEFNKNLDRMALDIIKTEINDDDNIDPTVLNEVKSELQKGFDEQHSEGLKSALDKLEKSSRHRAEVGVVEHFKEIYKEKENEINQATLDGLISEEGRKSILIELANALSKAVEAKIKELLPRNNNLFIIKDSGARGNDGQIAQTLGLGGVTMKTLNSSFEVPILNSYSQGLTSFEMNIAAYGARQGVASTQLGTADAGYATRQMINMIGGIVVQEEDCGVTPVELPLKYGDAYKIIHTFDKIKTEPVLDEEGNKVLDENGKVLRKEIQDEEGNPIFESESVVIENKQELLERILINKTLTELDEDTSKYLKNFIRRDRKIDSLCVKMIFKKKIRKIQCEDGVYEIRYKLDAMYKDLLTRRFTDEYEELTDNGVITNKVISKLEEVNPKSIRVRLMLNCRTKAGVCQHCYGMKFDEYRLPFIGERVGIESAQAIGEPSAQLVMSLFHKGGRAGDSVSSGVALNNSVLKGGLPKRDRKAIHVPRSGYVTVNPSGQNAVIEFAGRIQQRPSDVVEVYNGEYVDAYERITQGLPVFNTLGLEPDSVILEKADEFYVIVPGKKGSVLLSPSFTGDIQQLNFAECKDLIYPVENFKLAQQLTLLGLYYTNFRDNKISIYTRHFEILTRVQTNCIEVVKTNIPSLKSGDIEEYTNVRCGLEDIDGAYVIYPVHVANQKDVVKLFGGPVAAMAFERALEFIADSVSSRQVISEKGLMGKIFIGENITEDERKVLKAYEVKSINRVFEGTTNLEDKGEEPEIMMNVIEDNLSNVTFNMDDFNLSDFKLDTMDLGLEDSGLSLDDNLEPNLLETSDEEYKVEDKEKAVEHKTVRMNFGGGEK